MKKFIENALEMLITFLTHKYVRKIILCLTPFVIIAIFVYFPNVVGWELTIISAFFFCYFVYGLCKLEVKEEKEKWPL